MSDDGKDKNVMLKVAGKSFKCSCGCNVFHKPNPSMPWIYKCNACETTYSAD